MKTRKRAEMPTEGIAWHALPLEAVISLHVTDISSGLSNIEANLRKGLVQMEEVENARNPGSKQMGLIFRVLAVICFILVFSAFLFRSVLFGSLGLLLAVGTLVWGFYRPERARLADARLRQRLVWHACVLRNGQLTKRPASELVPGDIIVIKSGDFVPADARLFEAESLSCLERPLVESTAPIEKSIAAVATNTPLNQRRDIIYMGTFVNTGHGRAIVVATGSDTAISMLADPRSPHIQSHSFVGILPVKHPPSQNSSELPQPSED